MIIHLDKVSLSHSINQKVDKAESSDIRNTTHAIGQNIFRAKACTGIQYTFSDQFNKSFISVIKWVLCPITLPIGYFIKRFVEKRFLANERTKMVDKELVQQLEDLGGIHIDFEAEDGVNLKGMMFNNPQQPRSGKTILICSGSHKSQETYNVPIVKALLALGHNVMTFNYRGFGLSEGEASESGLYMDGEAAYQYILNNGVTTSDLVVYGYSLGGAVASDLAAKHKIDVVLDRTFSSGSDQAEEVAPKRLGWLARMVAFIGCEFDNVKKLKYVKGNIFIYQENQANRHNTFLKRMKTAISQARCDSIESLEASGVVMTAYGANNHFHSEKTLWFGVNSQSRDKIKLQKFLIHKH